MAEEGLDLADADNGRGHGSAQRSVPRPAQIHSRVQSLNGRARRGATQVAVAKWARRSAGRNNIATCASAIGESCAAPERATRVRTLFRYPPCHGTSATRAAHRTFLGSN